LAADFSEAEVWLDDYLKNRTETDAGSSDYDDIPVEESGRGKRERRPNPKYLKTRKSYKLFIQITVSDLLLTII